MWEYKCVRLKDLRIEKNLTIEDLAKLMNTSAEKVKYWENCIASPDFAEMAHLTSIFDANTYYITGKHTVRKIPDCIPYSQMKKYVKEQDKINRKKLKQSS